MTERENFDKYDNLGEDKLNTKSNKEVDVRNDVMTSGIKRCRGERKIDGFRKKLMIPESEISECSKYDVKSKKGKHYLSVKKFLKKMVSKFIKLILIFISTRKKYKLMRTDANINYLELMFIFLNINQLQKLMKKDILTKI